MSETSPRTPEEIWNDDLLGRREEADALQGYIASIVNANIGREDAQAFTIAVDAPYGFGKTYFLRRLAEQLSLNHPVAFIDAWADDLVDEPLTALAATLDDALSPLKGNFSIKKKIDALMPKIGAVAKVATIGVVTKTAEMLITAKAVQKIEELFERESTQESTDGKEKIKGKSENNKDIIQAASKAWSTADPGHLMNDRIVRFKEGKAAIASLKDGLKQIIENLRETDLWPPIVIFIDELDRCRPNYAVKLLEEIKHVFDVPGLVFVLGLNGEQLGHSLSGAYGPNFDGHSYLRRFIHRRYEPIVPDLTRIIEILIKRSRLDQARLQFHQNMRINEKQVDSTQLSRIIASYMSEFGLGVREAFSVVHNLQTCLALIRPEHNLILPLLLPKILVRLKTGEKELEKSDFPMKSIVYSLQDGRQDRPLEMDGAAIYSKLDELAKLSQRDLNREEESFCVQIISRHNAQSNDDLSRPKLYSLLLETVGRIKEK